MIILTFYSLAERQPERGQTVIHLAKIESDLFAPTSCVVSKYCIVVDSDGFPTGETRLDIPERLMETDWRYEFLFGSRTGGPDDHWCAVEDWWDAIDKGTLK